MHPLLKKLIAKPPESALLKDLTERKMSLDGNTPRVKARLLVQAISDAVLACKREQRHLFGYSVYDSLEAVRTLAETFMREEWCPQGLTREDIERVGSGVIEDVCWVVAIGHSLHPIEAKIYALLKLQDTPVSEVSEQPHPRHPNSRLRPRPRREL